MPLLLRRPKESDPRGTIKPVSSPTPTSAKQRVEMLEEELDREKSKEHELREEIRTEKRNSDAENSSTESTQLKNEKRRSSLSERTKETGDIAIEALRKSKDAAEAAMQHPRRYFKNTLLVTSLLFLLNGLFCYLGTGADSPLLSVCLFYGWVDGEHRHLQKTAGVFCCLVAVINFLPYLPQYDTNAMYVFTACVDAVVIFYYATETFVYWSIRAEVMVTMAFVLFINCAWALYSYQARKYRRDQTRKELKKTLEAREQELESVESSPDTPLIPQKVE